MTNQVPLDQLEIEQHYIMVDASTEQTKVVYLGRAANNRLLFKVNSNLWSHYELALLPRDLSQKHFFRSN